MATRRFDKHLIGGEFLYLERGTKERSSKKVVALNMSTGGYVDLLHVPTSDTTIEIDCQHLNVVNSNTNGSHNIVGEDIRFYMGVSNSKWRVGYGTTYQEVGTAVTTRKLLKLTGNGNFYVNDTLNTSFTDDISLLNDSFKLWHRGNVSYNNIIIYGVRIWVGNTLFSNLIPISASERPPYATTRAVSHCFWDTIRKQYFYSTSLPDAYSLLVQEIRFGCPYSTDNEIEYINLDLVKEAVPDRIECASYNTDFIVEFRDFYKTYSNLPEETGVKSTVNITTSLIDLTPTTRLLHAGVGVKTICEINATLGDL